MKGNPRVRRVVRCGVGRRGYVPWARSTTPVFFFLLAASASVFALPKSDCSGLTVFVGLKKKEDAGSHKCDE